MRVISGHETASTFDRDLSIRLQVALYDYDTTSDAWTNTDVEGSLFLYERVVAPYHGFTISNRKQPNNHWEALNEHVEFQNPEDDHFLLYKNREKIFGIWFFDVADRRKIGDLARQLVAGTTTSENLNQNGEKLLSFIPEGRGAGRGNTRRNG